MPAGITLDEFKAKINETRATCKICGHTAHSLTSHLKERHNLSFNQYREKYPSSTVISPIVSELLRQLNRTPKTSIDLDEYLPAFVKAGSDVSVLFEEFRSILPAATDPQLKLLVPSKLKEFYFDPKQVKTILYGMTHNENTYVEGPTGAGKTEIVFQIHAQLGLPMKRVNMNGEVTIANFLGSKQADPATGTYFKYGNLPLAMKGGYTLLLDEIDYAPPSVAAVLNPVLESKRMLYIPETDETIIAAPGFKVIATANTGGKGDFNGAYTGTEIQNTAFLDRFALKLKIDYMPVQEEVKMLQARFPAQDVTQIQKMVKVATEVRKAFAQGSLPMTISTRKLIGIMQAEGTLGLTEAVNCAIMNWLDEGSNTVVKKMFETAGLRLQ